MKKQHDQEFTEAQLWEKDEAYELRLWASYRGQTLVRTVRGMMYYERCLLAALRNFYCIRVHVNGRTSCFQCHCSLHCTSLGTSEDFISSFLHATFNFRSCYFEEFYDMLPQCCIAMCSHLLPCLIL